RRFGLIIPGQQKKAPARAPQLPTRPSIFDESSNSSQSEDDAGAPQKRPSGKPGGVVSGPSLMERRLARSMQEKALAEDETIFQYDELYDDMASKREEAKETKKQEPRKAKYIGRLMEHAERRKLENELRIDRQVQKDREAEGEKFKDKEIYVTAAYRKKVESLLLLQAQDQRDEYLEAIGDVTKQKDLDGFYRHLYEQKLGTQQPVLKPKTAPSTDDVAYKPIKSELPLAAKQRSYRRRRSSEDDEQQAKDKTAAGTDESKPGSSGTKSHLANNIDADSDFSIDSSDDEEEQKEKEKEKATDSSKKDEAEAKNIPIAADKQEQQPAKQPAADANGANDADSDAASDAKEEAPPVVVKPPVDRTLIWRKRTVGEVFDAALARYHERKLARRA
ncbi:hypothetical protein KR222_000932, partial [Zaprionus bogoriensis]